MLGIREPKLYGTTDYPSLVRLINGWAVELGVEAECFQSNCEGEIVSKVQSAYNKFDGIIINAAAYSHTSIAILDALKAVSLPTVEVHLTEPKKRESFRSIDYVALYAEKTFSGFGAEGYRKALEYFADK